MATPVARPLFNDGKASLRLIRASLLRPSNTNAAKDQSLLAPPSGAILGQCQFRTPSRADLNRQVKASAPHLFGRWSLVGGEDWRGSGRKHCLAAEVDELEMRRRKEISEDEDEDDAGSDSDDAGDVGDFDVADSDDDDGDDDDDDEDDDDVDVPRKMRK